MSLHLVVDTIIRFGVIFFGATVVDIPTGLVVSVCEEVPSPNMSASRLHRNMVQQLDVWKELLYGKYVDIHYLLVTFSRLSYSISSLVGLYGVLNSPDAVLFTFLLGCFRFLQVK